MVAMAIIFYYLGIVQIIEYSGIGSLLLVLLLPDLWSGWHASCNPSDHSLEYTL